MRTRARIAGALVTGALLVAACTAPEPAGETRLDAFPPDGVPPVQEQDAATRDAIARMVGYFPNTVLTTQDEERVRFYDDLVRDKCVLINFMYTTCDGI